MFCAPFLFEFHYLNLKELLSCLNVLFFSFTSLFILFSTNSNCKLASFFGLADFCFPLRRPLLIVLSCFLVYATEPHLLHFRNKKNI